MSLPKTIDEINRLFDELIRDPWSQRFRPPRPRRMPPGTGWEVEIPVHGARRDDIVFSVEGREVTVAVRRRTAHTAVGRSADLARGQEEILRRSFALPEGSDLGAIEARFERDILRIRITLHEHER